MNGMETDVSRECDDEDLRCEAIDERRARNGRRGASAGMIYRAVVQAPPPARIRISTNLSPRFALNAAANCWTAIARHVPQIVRPEKGSPLNTECRGR